MWHICGKGKIFVRGMLVHISSCALYLSVLAFIVLCMYTDVLVCLLDDLNNGTSTQSVLLVFHFHAFCMSHFDSTL